MNARCFRSNTNRWLSPDTIVPDPTNPQSFNRYSYVYNNPLIFIDPSGHCTQNYADSPDLLDQCILGWNSIVNRMSEISYGPNGTGADYNDFVNYLLENATIDQIEGIMRGYEIDYGYTWEPYESPGSGGFSNGYNWTHAGNLTCQYWQSCYDPVSEYSAVGALGFRVIRDDWGNIYFSANASTSPGFEVMVGDIKIMDEGDWKDVEDLSVDQQEDAVKDFLTGWGTSSCAGMGVSVCGSSNPAGNKSREFGFSTPGISGSVGYTWLIYDKK
ncbi:MAG: RHS repeat-associated core domain-containing protein [Chloroflexota bacterium]